MKIDAVSFLSPVRLKPRKRERGRRGRSNLPWSTSMKKWIGGWNGVKIKIHRESRFYREITFAVATLTAKKGAPKSLFHPRRRRRRRENHSWVKEEKFELLKCCENFFLHDVWLVRVGRSRKFQTESRLDWIFTPRYAPALSSYFTWTVIVFS